MELNAVTIGFVVFTTFTLGGGFGVVTTRNLFQGTIWLMVSLFGVAGYFILLSAPFLAAVQILVYIGAIAILITFAVMLTRSVTRIKARYVRLIPSFVGSLVLFLILLLGITIPIFGGQLPESAPVYVATTRDLGAALVDENGYVVPFMLASVLLTARHDRRDLHRPRRERLGRSGEMVPLWMYLAVAAALFSLGVFGVLSRRNAVAILMSVELMLNAVNINLVAFWRYSETGTDLLLNGYAFTAFVLIVAAAEAAVGLAIIITVYRNRRSVIPEQAVALKG